MARYIFEAFAPRKPLTKGMKIHAEPLGAGVFLGVGAFRVNPCTYFLESPGKGFS